MENTMQVFTHQQYIDRGYFNVVESVFKKNGKKYVTKTPYVTPKGQVWLHKKMLEWANN